MGLKLGWKRKLVLSLLLFGVVFSLVGGILLNMILDAVIDSVLRSKLILKEGSMVYDLWQTPPVPVAFSIYVFDVVNIDEVQQGKAPPFVVERGPYVYRMSLHKTDIVRHDFNSTISYRQPEQFIFDREVSVGSDNDTFTTLNIPYFTVASMAKHYPAPIQTAVYLLMKAYKEKMFNTLTVHDIFWGYEDPVLELVSKALKILNRTSPIINGKFGFFSGKNNTDDGLYNVFSGMDGDLKKYMTIDRWNGVKYQDIWTTREANSVWGSDGSMFPPYVNSKSNLSMYDGYLRRQLHLQYEKKTSYKGVDGLHFVVPFSVFASGTENPHNVGFCTPSIKYCIPSGAYNFSTVAYGSPSYVSLPHFVGGDPFYFERVKGLHPDPEKHQPFFDIHPLLGVSLQARRRYQINIRMESLKHFPDFKNIDVTYLPIIWIDGIAQMNDHYTDMFRDEIQHMLDAMPYVRIALFCMAVIFVLISILLIFCWRRKDKKNAMLERTPLLGSKKINLSNFDMDGEMDVEPVIA